MPELDLVPVEDQPALDLQPVDEPKEPEILSGLVKPSPSYFVTPPSENFLTDPMGGRLQLVRNPVTAPEGLYNAFAKLGGSVVSPFGVAGLAAAPIRPLQPLVKGVIAGLGAKNLGEIYGRLSVPQAQPKTVGEAIETLGDITGAAAMTGAAVPEFRPAIKLVGGGVVEGKLGQTHNEVIADNKLTTKEIDQRGFVDDQGDFNNRAETAAQVPGIETKIEPGQAHATEVAKAQEELPSPTPPPEAAVPVSADPSLEQPKPVEKPLLPPAEPGETGEKGGGAALKEEIPETGAGGEKYGIAQRLREERAKAGQVEPIGPGKGIAAEAAFQRGRQLLEQGFDAPKALDDFEKTGQTSADAVMGMRAYGERLAAGARTIEEQRGTDSPEYRAAFKALSDWDRRTKPMATEAHKMMVAHQGESDLDTGTFTWLQRRHAENTGETFDPKVKKTAEEKAATVKKTVQEKDKVQAELFTELGKGVDMAAAEKRALAAASRTVRENAIRVADLEKKWGVDRAEFEKKAQAWKVQIDAAKSAEAKTTEAIRENAIRVAELEKQWNLARAAHEQKAQAWKIQLDAARTAQAKTAEATRKNAILAANLENKARIDRANYEKKAKVWKVQVDYARKALEKAQKAVRENAVKAAQAEQKAQADPIKRVMDAVKAEVDKGVSDFNDIRNKVATDLGMKLDQVTRIMQQKPRVKYLSDELWRKQQQVRLLQAQARRWVDALSIPIQEKALMAIPRAMFGAKVFGHGTVAAGTHAPMVAFQPEYWGVYFDNIGKMYRMAKPGKDAQAFYERQMQDLVRDRPGHSYTVANRAGLVNDPLVYEDYTAPEIVKHFTPTAGMGTRGYSMLKLLRQDMFDQQWNKLPSSMQSPEVAAEIARAVNHVTGVVSGRALPGTSTVLFAPRLEFSRAMWLFGDPIRMGRILAREALGQKVTPSEHYFAMKQLKEKAWVTGTLLSLLAANQGMLSAVGSKQKVNVTDPFRSDFMKFKVAGMDFAYGNAMVSMARLPISLFRTATTSKGKLAKLVYPDENVYSTVGKYVRSQMSPFAGTTTSLLFGSDYAERPLPRAGFGLVEGRKDIPKRLRAQGVTSPYTWSEFWTQQFAPIPVQEGLKEVWKDGLGMSDKQVKQAMKALTTISIMGGTGGRLTEDTAPPLK